MNTEGEFDELSGTKSDDLARSSWRTHKERKWNTIHGADITAKDTINNMVSSMCRGTGMTEAEVNSMTGAEQRIHLTNVRKEIMEKFPVGSIVGNADASSIVRITEYRKDAKVYLCKVEYMDRDSDGEIKRKDTRFATYWNVLTLWDFHMLSAPESGETAEITRDDFHNKIWKAVTSERDNTVDSSSVSTAAKPIFESLRKKKLLGNTEAIGKGVLDAVNKLLGRE